MYFVHDKWHEQITNHQIPRVILNLVLIIHLLVNKNSLPKIMTFFPISANKLEIMYGCSYFIH